MKKILYIITSIIFLTTANALEKTKEEKVAKYVLENIQKDYTSCYAFYKIANESFKKANAEKSGMMCKNLVENQKQRIDYWENKGNKKIK